ncbi:Chromatin assembly factor 1 subunit A [Penicillium coprophilum]|uniref:Chromatin assembly factor 1 subunit A n=1 Tax=Penicillium coprophilum TaxID=36646 RepID=UPI00239A1656|nr:Chromatin assembly factor 1 subunit A [Penicillium coprophilum]KAJ5165247.1 Chromatin assembly factor 1 subunit A [Penicillium coprophilum]
MVASTSLSPMQSATSFPASPSSGPRKRSIHEVDDAHIPSPNAKRPLTEFAGENQENHDPSISPSQTDDVISPPVEIKHTLPPPPRAGAPGLTSTGANAASSQEPDTPASKKRKVVSAGTDSKQQEKEAKERQKAEEKARKEEEKVRKEEEKAKREEERRLKAEDKKKRDAERDEEKRHREEEKRKKDAQREEERKQRDEKKKAKEDEKAAKEEEKRKKDEEKEKKTRSQLKLNSFFAKPPAPSASSGQVITAPSPKKPSTTAEPSRETRSVQSDYAREFPAFFLQSHTSVAPPHRFERDPEALKHVRETIDTCLRNETPAQIHPFRPSEVFQIIPFHRGHQPTTSVRDILLQLQRSDENDPTQPIESQSIRPSHKPEELLRKVTMKSLKFGEDIRPPYQGTYTRCVSELCTRRLARNPFYRGLPDTDYDYDSEAEWEEPEEGEELDSEEEDEGSDEGEDDLEGFLDDEDDAPAEGKRRLIVGDLEPVSTGIQWASNGVEPEMEVYRMETISDAVKYPIDPFSTAYWEKPKPVDQVPAKARPVTGIDGFLVPAVPAAVAGSALPPTSKAKRPFPPDQLADFKEAVEGSDLSKIGLVEILKKRLVPTLSAIGAYTNLDVSRFPKVSKDTLKATLDQVAARVGQKEVDKKWVCR